MGKLHSQRLPFWFRSIQIISNQTSRCQHPAGIADLASFPWVLGPHGQGRPQQQWPNLLLPNPPGRTPGHRNTWDHLSKRSLRAWLSSSPSWPVKCSIRGCRCERSIIKVQHILCGQCTYRFNWWASHVMWSWQHVRACPVHVWCSHTASCWLILATAYL